MTVTSGPDILGHGTACTFSDVRATVDLFRSMLMIRKIEERVIAEYPSRRIRMAVHLSNGQEGVAVAVLGGSRATDTVVGTHRSHAIYLAKGGHPQAFVDELYGLPSGCSGGVGGSMHLSAPEVGLVGSSAVLGGGVPIAVGLAEAHRRTGRGDVSFAITGDGGIDEGSFWEALNLAALRSLPVLFVIENNGYSTLTPPAVRQARTDVLGKAAAFGVDAVRVDGTDARKLAEVVDASVGRIRAGEGPLLIEATTFRFVAHVGVESDFGKGRPTQDADRWPAEDPIERIRPLVVDAGEDVAVIEASVATFVDEIFRSAIERFEAANVVAGLQAPPPPRSAAV
jgi:TPP-dependent pyruvate/acetoin dehydrogenase alpha subunit